MIKKILSIDLIEMYAYGTNEGIIHIKIIQVNPYNKTIQK